MEEMASGLSRRAAAATALLFGCAIYLGNAGFPGLLDDADASHAVVAREIYGQLGGASPLLANTRAQAAALEAELGAGYRCFIAMRYWHPLTEEAVAAVAAWRPDEIVLLPLYPQYSTVTTRSSMDSAALRILRAENGKAMKAKRSRP